MASKIAKVKHSSDLHARLEGLEARDGLAAEHGRLCRALRRGAERKLQHVPRVAHPVRVRVRAQTVRLLLKSISISNIRQYIV